VSGVWGARPLSTSSAVDLFWTIRVVSRTLDHHHADKGTDDSDEDEDEDDRELDCPFTRRKEVVQCMIFVHEGLSMPSVHMGGNEGREREDAGLGVTIAMTHRT